MTGPFRDTLAERDAREAQRAALRRRVIARIHEDIARLQDPVRVLRNLEHHSFGFRLRRFTGRCYFYGIGVGASVETPNSLGPLTSQTASSLLLAWVKEAQEST
jgi:hypothetical protein